MRGIDKAIIVIAGIVVVITVPAAVWIAHSLKTGADVIASGSPGAAQNYFTGIGRQRIPLKTDAPRTPENQTTGAGPTVIISVVFPYDAGDTPFTEELVKNIPFFRKAITGFFGSLTAADPRLHDETTLKTQLLNTFNSRLHLGVIDRLYFSEFIMLD